MSTHSPELAAGSARTSRTAYLRTAATTSWQLGPRILGGAAAALGLLGLWRGDFTIVWHPVPETLPARTALAYLAAILLIAAGVGVQATRFRTAGGILLASLFVLLGMQWLVRVLSYPQLIGTWLGYSEQLALALGGVMIALLARRPDKRAIVICRTAFGIFQLVFGLGHFISLSETVAMTPSWLTPSPTFWALATGAAHFLGGVAFIFGIWPKAGAAALAAMFFSFALLVWLPALVANPAAPVPLPGLIVTIALTGAMLSLRDLLEAGQQHSAGAAESTFGGDALNVAA